MCKYYSKEERIKAMKTKVEYLRRVAGMYPVFADVTRRFDGKVLNRRYGEALSEAISADDLRLYTETRGSIFTVYAFERGTNYTLAYINIDDLPGEKKKRVSADLFLEAGRKGREQKLKEAADLERAVNDYDAIIGQIEKTKSLYNKLVEGLPYYMRDVCGFQKMYF